MISIIVLPAGYFHTKESTETKLSASMGPRLICEDPWSAYSTHLNIESVCHCATFPRGTLKRSFDLSSIFVEIPDNENLSNYRPISNLFFLSKRLPLLELTSLPHQFGFSEDHST